MILYILFTLIYYCLIIGIMVIGISILIDILKLFSK
jgi:hypothetical protein